ncbi:MULTISPECIES: YafY family protein [Listeria]|uniref:helix-turn-helix transcriptional regulator n=1 Tax=Listeria TaxID=1637 RepID=UPI000B59336A|nr:MULTISPECIES: YafY family protein [Listeria]
MRFSRMLAIVLLLVSKRKVTVQTLADFFEVSERTIYRDLEALDYAGIPIISTPGFNGGISIMENYYLDKQLFSSLDFKYMLLSLYRLNIENDPNKTAIIEKLQLLFDAEELQQIEQHAHQVVVDFSSWQGTKTDDAKFMRIQEAIKSNHQLMFTYTKLDGHKKQRMIESYQLLFKSGRWYLSGTEEGAPKLFLLDRIKHIELGQPFNPNLAYYERDFIWQKQNMLEFVLRIDRSIFHIFESWHQVEIIEEAEPFLRLKIIAEHNAWLETFILGLGSACIVESPASLRALVSAQISDMYKNYKGDDNSGETNN